MLGKLLKYEIPALGRKLVPLYLAWAVTAVLLGLMIGPIEGKSEFFMVISAMLYSAVATAVFVMAVIMIVQRYNHSLLGDEGYFSHVLPVKAGTHIAGKTISATLWVLLSVVAMALTGLIIAVCSGHFTELFQMDWKELFKALYGTPITGVYFVEFLIAFVLSIAKSILAIYTALTIGHQASRRVGLASLGAYIGLLIAESFIGNILIRLAPKTFLEPETAGAVALLILAAIVVTIIIGGIYFFICRYLMEKKLNLA